MAETRLVPARSRIGSKFGRLTVVAIERRLVGNSKWTKAFAKCVCECGTEPIIALSTIVAGRSRSCGCYNRDSASKRAKHGLRRHPLYSVWLGMKNRCNNPRGQDYKRYGGRGVYVSARWQAEFTNFIADMGERPTRKHTIERIDNNGPYAWWNCRWATRIEQAHNMESNRRIRFAGEELILIEWARRFGITSATLHESIALRGEQAAIARAARRAGVVA